MPNFQIFCQDTLARGITVYRAKEGVDCKPYRDALARGITVSRKKEGANCKLCRDAMDCGVAGIRWGGRSEAFNGLHGKGRVPGCIAGLR